MHYVGPCLCYIFRGSVAYDLSPNTLINKAIIDIRLDPLRCLPLMSHRENTSQCEIRAAAYCSLHLVNGVACSVWDHYEYMTSVKADCSATAERLSTITGNMQRNFVEDCTCSSGCGVRNDRQICEITLKLRWVQCSVQCRMTASTYVEHHSRAR